MKATAAARHVPCEEFRTFEGKWNENFDYTRTGGTYMDPNGQGWEIPQLKTLRWIASAVAYKHSEVVGRELYVSAKKMHLE